MCLEGKLPLLTEEESMQIKTALLQRKIKRRELTAQINALRVADSLTEPTITGIINRHAGCSTVIRKAIFEVAGLE